LVQYKVYVVCSNPKLNIATIGPVISEKQIEMLNIIGDNKEKGCKWMAIA
jgi:hypothetical protein